MKFNEGWLVRCSEHSECVLSWKFRGNILMKTECNQFSDLEIIGNIEKSSFSEAVRWKFWVE